MTQVITLDKIIKNENYDKTGNPFNVYYIFTKEGKTFTAYDNTKGIDTLRDTNNNYLKFKMFYNENIKNGKTYCNCFQIEPYVEIPVEPQTPSNTNNDLLKKHVSELTKEEERDVLIIILKTLIDGINKINQTLDKMSKPAELFPPYATLTSLNKEIIREPVDDISPVASQETLTNGLPF